MSAEALSPEQLAQVEALPNYNEPAVIYGDGVEIDYPIMDCKFAEWIPLGDEWGVRRTEAGSVLLATNAATLTTERNRLADELEEFIADAGLATAHSDTRALTQLSENVTSLARRLRTDERTGA